MAVYCLFREILKSRYTVYLILAAFLTIDVVCIDEIYGIARLQYTIPQEFGLYTLFLCTLYLVRFLKRENKGFDGNLFLFMTSLAASLAIHFYVTIMAFFLCASFAVFGLNQIFRKKNFGVLVTAVILGVVISTLPMVLAFALRNPASGISELRHEHYKRYGHQRRTKPGGTDEHRGKYRSDDRNYSGKGQRKCLFPSVPVPARQPAGRSH